MPVGLMTDGGAGVVEALLAWRRLPWVHAEQVRSLRVLKWSARGWCGTLYLRGGLNVTVALDIDRDRRRAQIDWQVERARTSSPAELTGAERIDGQLMLSWGCDRTPATLSARLVYRDDSGAGGRALSGQLVSALEQELGRALAVLAERRAQFDRRMDGAALGRCSVCLGPLPDPTVQMAGAAEPARCAWEGHKQVTAAGR